MQTNISLNEEQMEAVNHVWGPCFVASAPGSGKTRVIIERCARLIQKEDVDPKMILCITFTNKAAAEMKERLVQHLGDSAKKIYISTFHALCANILRKFGEFIGYDKNMSILSTDDQESLLSQCARQKKMELSAWEIRGLLWNINSAREKLIDPDTNEFAQHVDGHLYAEIARDYIDRMRSNNQIDFSGLLSETIRLFEKDADTLETLRDRWEFIQVDEGQDTSFVQFKFIEMIGTSLNIFMVADSDQSIYGWRNARYENVQDFIDNFDAKIIHLPLNYRSTKEIVKTARTLIEHNPNRQKIMFETLNEEGIPVSCYHLDTPDQEGHWVASGIAALIRNHGYQPRDFAVLYRNNAMSRAIETGMVRAGIDYEVIGAFGFFDRTEVKDSLAMLRFYVNPKDGLALARFINKPSRRIGQMTIAKIEKFAQDNNIDLVESMRRAREYISGSDSNKIVSECQLMASIFAKKKENLPIGNLLREFINRTKYEEFLAEKMTDNLTNRLDNIEELCISSSVYGQDHKNDISDYLNQVALQTSTDKSVSVNAVTLMTLHSSKGLEWPVVFMPCLDDGSLPSHRALQERDSADEEERRLCYVGMTRAKKRLIISYPDSRPIRSRQGKIITKQTKPSRFIAEAGLADASKKTRAF